MLTIDNIKMCKVVTRGRDRYNIRCVIKQFGDKIYTYMRGREAIFYGKYNEKCLLLSGNAVKTVEEAVEAFDAEINAALSYKKIGEAFYIKSDKAGRYDALIREADDILLKGASLPEVLKKIPEHYIPGAASLDSSELYLYAVESGDRFLKCELEVMFGNISAEDLQYLTETTGEVWIPRLGDAYDKAYIIDSETIDHDALRRSGFKVIHKPYFAMSGYTHAAYSVNPHTKRVLDAVPHDSELMSYEDFLKLFER